MFRFCMRLLPPVLATWAIAVSAQDASTTATAVAPIALVSAAAGEACSCTVIPALTPVSIEILAPLGSKTSKTGDSFPLRLAAPIVIDGKEVVPAGATGMGEVIHAKKSGGMGAGGELVLAARYLDIGGQRLALRSFALTVNGKSNIGAVDGLAVASAASPLPVGIVGFFITGGQVTVPQGTVAQAKTRENFSVPVSTGATLAKAPDDGSSTGEKKQ